MPAAVLRVVRETTTRTMIRSGLSGAAGTGVDLAALAALVESGAMAPAPAAALSALAGALVCFALNKAWAFRDPSPVDARSVLAFGVVAGGSAALNAGFVHLFAVVLHQAYLLAKAAAAALVFATWSYPTQSRFVFSRGR